MERYTIFLDQKNQYCENNYIIQSNLQIAIYQVTNSIFHRIRTKNFTICMETQRTPNSQKQSWERKMELEESGSLTSDYTTMLQSSRQYGPGIGQKYRPMEQCRKLRDKPMKLWVPYLDIEGKIIQQRKDSLFNNWWASLVAQLVKNACNAGDLGLIPGLWRSPGEGKGCSLSILSWRILWTV